jgi:5-methylcytosine-specific restriction endonuclease McrA
MKLPEDFIKLARDIRNKRTSNVINGKNTSLLGLNRSRYNANVIKGDCSKCGVRGVDVHHKIHQSQADTNGFIIGDDSGRHKNHSSNLMCLCKKCHMAEHAELEDTTG